MWTLLQHGHKLGLQTKATARAQGGVSSAAREKGNVAKKIPHPHVRLAFEDGIAVDPRRKAQSTSGHVSSQRTSPIVSRSKEIASDSEHGRVPYTTFLRCPTVVSHRSASDSRCAGDSVFQKGLSFMPDYHHTVISNATPFGEFTEWCFDVQTSVMKIAELAGVRRTNLRRYVDDKLDGNVSELNRRYRSGKGAPSYFNDLLAGRKSFGEKVARAIEKALNLAPGQLDLKDSPLVQATGKDVADDQLHDIIATLTATEKRQLIGYAASLRDQRQKSARKTSAA